LRKKTLSSERDILDEANLGKHLSLIIQEGEIHVIPKSVLDAQKALWKSWPDVLAKNQPHRMTFI
jgi:hypothetical protein